MIRRKFLFCTAILAGIVWAGLAPPARADFEVLFKVDRGGGNIDTVLFTVDSTKGGGGFVTVSLAAGGSTNATSKDFDKQVFTTLGDDTAGAKSLSILFKGAIVFTLDGITIKTSISDSNSPGTPALATIDFGNTAIKNTKAIAQTVTMTIGDTGFTDPSAAKLDVTSTISATADGKNTGAKSVITSDSYIDTTDKQFGTQQHVTPGSTLTLGKGESGSDNVTNTLSGPAPYSVTQIVGVSLDKGNSLVSVGGATNVVASVPAPAGVLLALSGIPILGLSYLRRRVKRVIA